MRVCRQLSSKPVFAPGLHNQTAFMKNTTSVHAKIEWLRFNNCLSIYIQHQFIGLGTLT